MKAIILCGGKGTRLGKLTEGKQKCMLDVDGRPFLRYVVDNIKGHLTSEIVLCGNYKDATEIESEFTDEVWYSWDNDKETQMDALRRVAKKTSNALVIMNGDTIFGVDTNHKSVEWKNGQKWVINHNGKLMDLGVYEITPNDLLEIDHNIETINQFKFPIAHTILPVFFVDIGTPEGLQYAKDNIGVIKNALYKA